MSTATIGQFGIGAAVGDQPCRPVRSRTRPARVATATRRGPIARPSVRSVDRRGQRPGGVSAPAVARRPRPEAATSEWRLTDRGIAVVMGLGLVLVAIALAVVVNAAITVTDESYRPTAAHQAR